MATPIELARAVYSEPCRFACAGMPGTTGGPLAEYMPLILAASKTYGVHPSIIIAVMWTESRFRPFAKSSAGAMGLMQLMPTTANYLAKKMGSGPSPWEPAWNIRAGTLLLAGLLKRWGSLSPALAAYFAGSGNVKKYGTDPAGWTPAMRKYVAAVMRRYRSLDAVIRNCIRLKSWGPGPHDTACPPNMEPLSPGKGKPKPRPRPKPKPAQPQPPPGGGGGAAIIAIAVLAMAGGLGRD